MSIETPANNFARRLLGLAERLRTELSIWVRDEQQQAVIDLTHEFFQKYALSRYGGPSLDPCDCYKFREALMFMVTGYGTVVYHNVEPTVREIMDLKLCEEEVRPHEKDTEFLLWGTSPQIGKMGGGKSSLLPSVKWAPPFEWEALSPPKPRGKEPVDPYLSQFIRFQFHEVGSFNETNATKIDTPFEGSARPLGRDDELNDEDWLDAFGRHLIFELNATALTYRLFSLYVLVSRGDSMVIIGWRETSEKTSGAKSSGKGWLRVPRRVTRSMLSVFVRELRAAFPGVKVGVRKDVRPVGRFGTCVCKYPEDELDGWQDEPLAPSRAQAALVEWLKEGAAGGE